MLISGYKRQGEKPGNLVLTIRHRVERVFIRALIDERTQEAALRLKELLRAGKLDDLASVEDQLPADRVNARPKTLSEDTHDLVRVHDRLQAVRDRDHRHVPLELRPQRGLDDRIRLVVDRGRRLVENEQLALPHDGSRQGDDLAPLSDKAMSQTAQRTCLCPTLRLPPLATIWLSSVSRFSSASDWTENSPAERRASLSSASSWRPNMSKFLRSVPLMSSGCVRGS
jgi:hypothetical protein